MTTATVPKGFTMPVYAPIVRWLHWGIAILIFVAIAEGVTAIYLPRGPVRAELLSLHKSVGVTVLGLVVLRIVARFATGTPDYRPALGAFTEKLAALAHVALYALMILLPISGYVHSSAGNHPFDWFGLYPIPQWVGENKTIDQGAGVAHYFFALAIGAVLALHFVATAWHRYVKKDGVFERMWPNR